MESLRDILYIQIHQQFTSEKIEKRLTMQTVMKGEHELLCQYHTKQTLIQNFYWR